MKQGRTKRGSPKSKGTRLSRFLKVAAYSSLGLGAGDSLAESVITFEGFTDINIDIATIPGYGDNINSDTADWTIRKGRGGIFGTPDITMEWVGTGWDTYTGWDGRGSVGQTDFNEGSVLSLLFTPTADFAVRVVSFELDEWSGGGPGSINWTLSGAVSGILGSGNWVMGTEGGRSGIVPDATGRNGEELLLSFTLISGAPSYFALDNLTFDQVPEPSTWAMGAFGAAGLGAMAMRRRRRA